MKCLTWNIEWATENSPKGKLINKIVADIGPDVICFTEATLGMIPNDGYVIGSDPDYGYSNHGIRRKVLLWSKQPWLDVDSVGIITSVTPNPMVI